MRQSHAAPELLVRIDRATGEPLRAQLERELRSAIRAGRLKAGTELPSTRALAADLGLSRGIVVEAYEQLLAEGYLTARQGSATAVASGALERERASTERAARETGDAATTVLRYDFRPSAPDTTTFPRRAWHRSLRKALTGASGAVFGYPEARGMPQLRSALAEYLNRARGTNAHPDRMVTCNGFTQGFRLACAVLGQRGARAIATEDPSHDEQRAAIRALGLKVVTVPVDEQGLIVEKLERSGADAVLLTPAHQFPTGSVLAPQRRAALIEWAIRRKGTIIEDDYDAEFRYDREPIGSLQGVAPDRVIYVGSASKTLAPALRLGWMLAPGPLVEALAAEKKREDRGSPALEQLAFADFIESGELDRHLRRMRHIYRRRRDLLTKALRAHLPKRRVSGIAAGMHLLLELPAGTNEGDVVEAAAKLSVAVSGIGDYRARAKGPPALTIGYGSVRDSAITEGIKRLASVIG